jgi:hypothetical protein
MIDLILLIVAAVCFGAAALGFNGGRINLVAAGLLCLTLVQLI